MFRLPVFHATPPPKIVITGDNNDPTCWRVKLLFQCWLIFGMQLNYVMTISDDLYRVFWNYEVVDTTNWLGLNRPLSLSNPFMK